MELINKPANQVHCYFSIATHTLFDTFLNYNNFTTSDAKKIRTSVTEDEYQPDEGVSSCWFFFSKKKVKKRTN